MKSHLMGLRNHHDSHKVIRSLIGWSAAAFGAICAIALLLGMINVIPNMHQVLLHQSLFRWLAEGSIGGLMIAAIAFWRP
jgi:hypothetical protein